jgi:hypothetical protein
VRLQSRSIDFLTHVAIVIALTVLVTQTALASPSVTFTYSPHDSRVSQPVSFTGHVSGLDSSQAVTAYQWCYGYGSCVTPHQSSVTHAFPDPGDYQVEFAAYLSDGSTQVAIVRLTISAQPRRPSRPGVAWQATSEDLAGLIAQEAKRVAVALFNW